MPRVRRRKRKLKLAAAGRKSRGLVKRTRMPVKSRLVRSRFAKSRSASIRRDASVAAAEIARTRAEAEAAIADARRSHERLREAIELLPQGIVFLDAQGRYILWNRQYAEIYSRSADLFAEGTRLEDTLRIGVTRGDYPEAAGRE